MCSDFKLICILVMKNTIGRTLSERSLIAVFVSLSQPVLWLVILINLAELAESTSSEHHHLGFIRNDGLIALGAVSSVSVVVSMNSHVFFDIISSVLVRDFTKFLGQSLSSHE